MGMSKTIASVLWAAIVEAQYEQLPSHLKPLFLNGGALYPNDLKGYPVVCRFMQFTDDILSGLDVQYDLT